MSARGSPPRRNQALHAPLNVADSRTLLGSSRAGHRRASRGTLHWRDGPPRSSTPPETLALQLGHTTSPGQVSWRHRYGHWDPQGFRRSGTFFQACMRADPAPADTSISTAGTPSGAVEADSRRQSHRQGSPSAQTAQPTFHELLARRRFKQSSRCCGTGGRFAQTLCSALLIQYRRFRPRLWDAGILHRRGLHRRSYVSPPRRYLRLRSRFLQGIRAGLPLLMVRQDQRDWGSFSRDASEIHRGPAIRVGLS